MDACDFLYHNPFSFPYIGKILVNLGQRGEIWKKK
jgi:hypothetical protein